VIVDGLERVEEADRLVLGERDPALIGEHVSCPVGRGPSEEVAQRLAYRSGGRLVDGPLLVGEPKFKSLGTHPITSVRTPYGIARQRHLSRRAIRAMVTSSRPPSAITLSAICHNASRHLPRSDWPSTDREMTNSSKLFPRYAQPLILDALRDTRVVFIGGARQVGKSTLARHIATQQHPATEFSLDVRANREAALADPEGFVAGLHGPAFIDEVQRAPDLLLAIKDAVDRDPAPGRFLLTGSANVVTLRSVKDALTGRMEVIRLWPLAQSEIRGGTRNFVDALFAAAPPRVSGATIGRDAFVALVGAGGYPEARTRHGRRRERWFASYLETTLDRDLRDISDARRLSEVPQLLRLLAAQAANGLSYRGLATKLSLNHETVKEYVALLEAVFLVRTLPAWRPGIAAREVRAPKAYLVDSGLLAHVLGADEDRIAGDDQVTGKVLENFAVIEVLKHAEWANVSTTAYHYRQRDEEIDLILESRSGEIAAIEIKAAASVNRRDLKPIEKLRDARGEHFKAGVLLCTTGQTTPLGDRLWAIPLEGLWT